MELNGQQVYYEEYGSGVPVLFLHGWGANTKSWGTVLASMGQQFHAYALDFPGFGGQSPEPTEPWEVSDYADLVIAFMDACRLEKVNLVGHSYGGRVSIELANKVPERIDKIVLTDAAGVKPKRSLKYHIKVRTYKLAKKVYQHKGLVKFLKAIGIDVEKRVNNAGSEDYRKTSPVMRQTLVKAVNYDQTGLLKNIKNPTLLVWGEDDTDTPMYMAKIMEKNIPDSGLVTFPGAGHFSYLADIPRYVKILSVFFGGN